MGWSTAAYADFLTAWWAVDRRTVLRSPAGVTVVLPLTEEQGEGFRDGRLHPNDVRPSRATPTAGSMWVHVNALMERGATAGLDRLWASTTLVNMMMSQCAAFSPCLRFTAARPTYLTFAADSANTKRAAVYGLSRNGARVPRSEWGVLEMGPPERIPRPTRKQKVVYELAITSLRMYQLADDPD